MTESVPFTINTGYTGGAENGFFEKAGAWVIKAWKILVKKTKDFVNVTKLQFAISQNNKKITKLFTNIGEAYFENHQNDAAAEELDKIGQVNALKTAIAENQDKIQQIKGIFKCAGCGADLPANSDSCPSCGTETQRLAPNTRKPAEDGVCPECGAFTGDETLCPGCGAKLKNAMDTAQDASDKNRRVGIVSVAALGILLLVFFISLISGGRGYKATVNQFVSAMSKAEMRSVIKLIPDDMIENALEQQGLNKKDMDAFVENLDQTVFSLKEQYEDRYGKNWKISHKILQVGDLMGDDLIALKDRYKSYNVRVSAAKCVVVELSIKGSEFSETETAEVYLIKAGNSWYLDMESMSASDSWNFL